MSIEIFRLQRIAITKETLANWGVDLTGSATFLDVPFVEGTADLKLIKDIKEPNHAQQAVDGLPTHVLGRRRAELSMTIPLYASGLVAGTSPAEDGDALSQILSVVMGGVIDANADGTVDVGNTASNFTSAMVAADDGLCIGWSDSAGVHYQEVRVESANNITMHHAFPSSPNSSDALYAMTTHYLTEDPQDSLQAIVEGAESDNRWLLYGMQLTGPPAITDEPGEIPTIQLTFTAADWAAEPQAAISAASYAQYNPIISDGEWRVQVALTTTRQILDVASASWTLKGPVYQPVASGLAAVNGQKRWRRKRDVPLATLNLVVPYEDLSFFTARDNKTIYHIERQMGMARGGSIVLVLGNARLKDVQPTNQDDLSYQTLTFECGKPSMTGAASTRSVLRIHRS